MCFCHFFIDSFVKDLANKDMVLIIKPTSHKIYDLKIDVMSLKQCRVQNVKI